MIDKSLYATPTPEELEGLEDLGDIEVIIDDPDADVVIQFEEAEPSDMDFDANLAEYLPEGVLGELATELYGGFEEDTASRKDWIQTYVDGLELLGLKLEDRSEPWEGACGVYHPLLAEALVKFQAETIMETLPASGPVKTQIIGKETTEKKDAAERVQDDMNYRITTVMSEYRSEHERMIWGLGLSGNAFKKVYFDGNLDREASLFVPAEDVVVPYGACDLETSPRVTHVMRKTKNELRKLQVAGFYRDIDLPDPINNMDEVESKIAETTGFRAINDHRYRLLEMQVDLDLEGYEDTDDEGNLTGIGLPYIVTMDQGSRAILSVRRNWDVQDILKRRRKHFVHYGYVPGSGFYYFGLIHLIGAYAKAGTSILRQLVDAGTLSNLPGGFKTSGLRIKGDDTPIEPGEFRDVDLPSGPLKDNILPLPYKEPSQVLMVLLDKIVEEGRRFASVADFNISDMSAQAPVGTTLAILERTLKVMSAVQSRIHASMKVELQLLKNIIRDNAPEEYPYEPEVGSRTAIRSDYDSCDVLPVSDPNAATMSQKVVQYQAALQLAQMAPQIYNLPLLHRQMLSVLGIKNADKLVKLPEDAKPQDPITENMNLLKMKPVKAFLYQDHKAHIAVHMAAIQDPSIQQLMAQNPMAQQIMAAAMAHISEHLALDYRKEMEGLMGMTLPLETDDVDEYEDAHMDPKMEAQVSQLAAQAAQQLLQRNTQQAKAQQAAQQAQDPLIQLQAKELEIKERDQQLKEKKLMVDATARADQLKIEKERIAAQERIAGMNAGVNIARIQEELKSKQQEAGLRAGIDIGKAKLQAEDRKRQQRGQFVQNAMNREDASRREAKKKEK